MKKIFYSILFYFIFLIPLFAFENTYDVLINRNKITASNWTTIKTKGLKTITDAGGQPFRMFMISSNIELSHITTNYYRIHVTCTDTTEKTYLANLVSSGKIKILNEYGVVKGLMQTTRYMAIPDDYYRIDLSTHVKG